MARLTYRTGTFEQRVGKTPLAATALASRCALNTQVSSADGYPTVCAGSWKYIDKGNYFIVYSTLN